MALQEGMKGSVMKDWKRIKLAIIFMTTLVLPLVLFSLSQKQESCKYLFPLELIYIVTLRPSLSSTLLSSYRYFIYLAATSAIN